MKIAINGEIIDTENIYRITEIHDSENDGDVMYHFKIMLFNHDYKSVYKYSKDCVVDKKDDKNYIELCDFRNKIIKVWSENQPTIPQFNLE